MSLHNFYSSKAWIKLLAILRSERIDEKGQVICEECGKAITRKYDCIGHHIEELTEENYTDANISLNPDNIILVHHRCHNKIHNKLSYSCRQVFIVYGAPLSGKTSYVSEVMQSGDLLVDVDNIWQCISGQPRYCKPGKLNANVFAVRDLLIDNIRIRRGKWNNAYIVGGYPLQSERERLINALGAREIFIDTDMNTCLERLAQCEDRDKKEWEKYITEWFEKNTASW